MSESMDAYGVCEFRQKKYVQKRKDSHRVATRRDVAGLRKKKPGPEDRESRGESLGQRGEIIRVIKHNRRLHR